MRLRMVVSISLAVLSLAVNPLSAQQVSANTDATAIPQHVQPSNVQPLATVAPVPPPVEAANPFSSELNSELPSWLRLSGEVRLRAAGIEGDFFKDQDDSYLLTRVRLNALVKPTNWLKFYFQGQDAHIVGASQTASLPPLQQDAMDLRLGYVEFGDIEQKSFRVRVGRQELAFGEERLIGPANWLNTPRSFDGALSSIRTSAFRLDAFAASVVKIHDQQFNENTPGNNIYGLYSAFPKFVPRATLEPYFIWRRQSGLTTETKKPGISNFGTAGFRFQGKLPRNFDYDLEMAKQAGWLGTDTVNAWAGHWLLGYRMENMHFTPRIFAEFNYASGDHNSQDGERGTFDQLFPSAHDLYGLTDQVGWKNIRHLRSGVEIKPRVKWTVSARYSSYWLADTHDALYNAASIVVARSKTPSVSDYVGQELDLIASFKANRWTLFSAGYGHLFPGAFLKATTPGHGFNYPYASVSYTF